ncbi:FAR1-related sequence 5-like protein [Tanacetum coccineum]|uniref:FAR1-related sequence 5-like protein n=1 Tax=Tanacetum coccineum TaxID=301880 RepID=A0ABQ5D4W0_9ASTR
MDAYTTPEKHVDESIKPILFTKFKSIDAAYESYKEYNRKSGFEVRKSTQEKNWHEVSHKCIVCSKEVFLPEKKQDEDQQGDKHEGEKKQGENGDDNKKQKRNRPSSCCECEAKICHRLTRDKKYKLYGFEEKHNHSLVHPDDRHYLKSLWKLNYSDKTLLVKISNQNIGLVVAYNILTEIHGGFNKVGALPQDAKIFKRDILACIGDSDANMIVKMLTRKKECVSEFSFEYRLADEKYGMKFVPFTGFNNHQRSVNLGAALLHTEATDSFKWMLEKFKEVFLRELKVVLTDQDPAMKVAIETIFVGTSISRSGFKKKISRIIWTDRLDPEEFNDKWISIVNEFHLEDNKWLSDMFNLREKWIPAYFRDMPLSRLMRTTSCFESENHMFRRLLNSDLSFVEFFSHFETAVQTQRKVFMDVVQKEMIAAVHACFFIGVVHLDESRKYTILDTDVKVNCFPKQYIQRRWTIDCVPMKSSDTSTIRHGLGEVQEQSGALIQDIYYTVDAIINRLLCDNTKLAAYKMVQKELLEIPDAEMENQPVMGNKEFIHAYRQRR